MADQSDFRSCAVCGGAQAHATETCTWCGNPWRERGQNIDWEAHAMRLELALCEIVKLCRKPLDEREGHGPTRITVLLEVEHAAREALRVAGEAHAA